MTIAARGYESDKPIRRIDSNRPEGPPGPPEGPKWIPGKLYVGQEGFENDPEIGTTVTTCFEHLGDETHFLDPGQFSP